MLKLFISYSHKDVSYKEELCKYLAQLATQKDIQIWSDIEIMPGQEFHPEIFNNLYQSQVILLLLSIDFLNSEFCFRKELASALELHESRRAVVIPVIVKPIPEYDYPFNKIQALPAVATEGALKGIRAMSAWPDFQVACIEVCKGIEKAIDNTMTGLLKDINNCNIDYRTGRIEEAILEGDILKACDLLMQLCIDFSPHNLKFKMRATAYKGTMQSLKKEQKDSGDEREKILMKILELMEDIRTEPIAKAA